MYYLFYFLLGKVIVQGVSFFRHRYMIPLWVITFFSIATIILKPKLIFQNLTNLSVLRKSAALSSLILGLFFTYGHVSNLLNEGAGYRKVMEIHRELLFLWCMILFVGVIFFIRLKRTFGITKSLNVVVSILFTVTLVQIGIWKIQSTNRKTAELETRGSIPSSSISDRDVYYIVLDGYGRVDYVSETTHLDTSSFVDELKSLGFVLPSCAQSNYHITLLSMASALNMEYLPVTPGKNTIYYEYEPYMKHSLVLKTFEDLGYETFTFKGSNPYTTITDVTHFYDYFEGEESGSRTETLNFYYLFLKTTLARPIMDYIEHNPQITDTLPLIISRWLPTRSVFSNRYYKQYQQSTYHLDMLEMIPELPGKKFVYAHLFMGHEPFVFTPEGEFRWPVREDVDAYIDQILFINNRLPKILRTIIAKSQKPPIIILQADHGWGWNEGRVRILNAYYLPNGGNNKIYPEITPVNTFRLVLNEYFHGQFEMLPDISYYANFNNDIMDNLSVVPRTCIGTE
jgi:hypothetical protein